MPFEHKTCISYQSRLQINKKTPRGARDLFALFGMYSHQSN